METARLDNFVERFDIRVSSPETGMGLFARTPIKKGAFVVEYLGQRIPTKVADESGGRYLFEVDSDWTIDGEAEWNTARYINHSCRPNVEAEIDENDRIMIYALRDIDPGEELTIDYGEEYFDEFIKPVGCKCDNCSFVAR